MLVTTPQILSLLTPVCIKSLLSKKNYLANTLLQISMSYSLKPTPAHQTCFFHQPIQNCSSNLTFSSKNYVFFFFIQGVRIRVLTLLLISYARLWRESKRCESTTLYDLWCVVLNYTKLECFQWTEPIDPFRLSCCRTTTTNQSRLQSSTTPSKRM